MKKLLLTLTAIVTTMIAQAAITTYTDKLVVTVTTDGGSTTTPAQDATISVEDAGNDMINLSLQNFYMTLEGDVMFVGNIDLENVSTVKTNGTTTFSTSQTINIKPGNIEGLPENMWIGPALGDVPVNMEGAIKDGKMVVNINIQMMVGAELQNIGVKFGKPSINPINSMNEVGIFEVTTGKTADLNFTLSGLGIAASDIHATIQTTSDLQQNAFSVAQNGESLTLTFKPTVVGTHTATITLSAEGADDVIVKVTGTAKAPTLVLTASTDELDFGDLKTGESATKTFTVTTENLTADVKLNILGSDAFTVSPAIIPISATSTEVTVTYTAGTDAATAQLNISTEAGEQTAKFVTVNLKGGVAISTAIDGIAADNTANVNVYSISGTLLRKNVPAATALQGLAKGIYLVNGKKVMK